MKKTVLCLSLFAVSLSFAQTPINITTSDIPTVGKRFLQVNNLSGLTSVNVGEAGENKTYNFANFPADTYDSLVYLELNNTPYASQYPNSNLVMLTLPDTSYTYLNSSSSALEVVGTTMQNPLSGGVVLMKSTNDSKLVSLPFTYGDSFTDEGSFQSPGIPVQFGIPSEMLATLGLPLVPDSAWVDSVKVSVTIVRNSDIDSWGTTVTPDGSYASLRQNVNEITNYAFEMHLMVQFGAFITPIGYLPIPTGVLPFPLPTSDTTTNYYYFTNATENAPALIAQVKQSNLGMITEANYAKIYNPAGIIETNNDVISTIYPNPVNDILKIETKENIQVVNVYSEVGQLVYNRNVDNSLLTVNTSSLISGIYFVEVISKNNREVKRFTKF